MTLNFQPHAPPKILHASFQDLLPQVEQCRCSFEGSDYDVHPEHVEAWKSGALMYSFSLLQAMLGALRVA